MLSQRVLKTGHVVENVSEEDFQRISKDFPMYDGVVRLQPGGWFTLTTMPNILDRIYDFDFRPTDTIVLTYPKSGTTWMQEIVWTLEHNPDLNNPMATLSIDMRAPHIEGDNLLLSKKVPKLGKDSPFVQYLQKIAPDRAEDEAKMLTLCEHLPDPRVIKSHLALELFPPKMLETSKVIYLIRDPRDVIISKYHFFRVIVPHSFAGTLDSFIDTMLNEEQVNHPYWPHIKLAYELRDRPNLLLLYFEDLKAKPLKVIKQISDFLGLDRTPEQIKNVKEFTDFKNMKARSENGEMNHPMSDGGKYYNLNLKETKEGHGFFRKGTCGTWKDDFTEEQIKKITAWMEKNLKMFPSDFPYKV